MADPINFTPSRGAKGPPGAQPGKPKYAPGVNKSKVEKVPTHGGFFLRTMLLTLEALQVAWIGPICADVIKVFAGGTIWGLSAIFPGLGTNDVLGFLQALCIVFIPVLAFKAALESPLTKTPVQFFRDRNNVIFFALGAAAIVGVFGLELYNMYAKALMGLEELVDCDPNNTWCKQTAVDAKREILERQVERALPLALLYSSVNLAIAGFTAKAFSKRKA